MAVPQRVPIARGAGYRTDTIGHYRHGQFYAAVRSGHRDDDRPRTGGASGIRRYAYLHLFDAGESHRESEISLIGVAPHLTGKRGAQAAARPMSLPGQLDEAGFGDIAIRLLAVTCVGVTFGLIDESGPDRGSRAELYPDQLGFSDAWDGTYSR